jgi:hypothetical protein
MGKIGLTKTRLRFICCFFYVLFICACCLFICLWRPGHIHAQSPGGSINSIAPHNNLIDSIIPINTLTPINSLNPLNPLNPLTPIPPTDPMISTNPADPVNPIPHVDTIDTIANTTGAADTANTADQAQLRSWLNQQIATLFPHKGGGRRLAAGSRPFRPFCATALMQAARKNPQLLDEQNKFILYRPTDATYQDYYYGPVKVLVYSTPEGHFRIHYTEDNSMGDAVAGSDGLVQTIPSYVLTSGKALETSWTKEVDTMGYNPPSTGDSKYDCYIMNLTYYGYSSIDQDDHPYMVIASDYNSFSDLPANQDPDGTVAGAIKVTVAHEFFHAIQYGYTDWDDQWWEENAAVWMEDEVFDQVNDYLHYLGAQYDDLNENGRWDNGESYYDSLGKLAGVSGRGTSGWFEWPFLPLDSSSLTYTKAEYQEYGGTVWVKYLSEKYGQDIVRSIFQRGKNIRQQGIKTKALDLIKAELASRGSSLTSELEEFRIEVLTREFEEGKSYPQVWHVGCFQQYPALFDSDAIYDSAHGGFAGVLNHLSAQYIRFEAPDGIGSVHFHFTRTYGAAPLSCPLILTSRSGLIRRVNLPIEFSTGSGEITLSGFGKDAEFPIIEAIPINISDVPANDKIGFTLKADFKAVPSSQLSLLPGMNLFSPVLPAAQSMDSHQLLLHYFTPDSLYSISAYDQETGEWIKDTLTGDSHSFSVSGPSFSLLPGGIYILNLKTSQTITLPYSSGPDTKSLLLRQGINLLSLTQVDQTGQGQNIPGQTTSGQTIQEQDLSEDSFKLLAVLGEKVSVIKQKSRKDGKWSCVYHFFQKPAGENAAICGEKTSIVDMVQDQVWQRN